MDERKNRLHDVPLFPLSAVLFPEGELRLRIFEPRYLDLVRECAGGGASFGVCLILKGSETDALAATASVGTLARIADFFSDENGLLGIRVQGRDRFEVHRLHMRDSGLARADVTCWPREPVMQLPPQFTLLADILRRLIEQAAPHLRHVEEARFDDASWVGFRLAELLPLEPDERQMMLELREPAQRLAALLDRMPRFQRG